MASRRKAAYRKKSQNKFAMFLVTMVLLMLVAIVSFKKIELSQKEEEYARREAELESQIADETERSESLEEYEKYTHTKKYYREVAHEKLGLVDGNEILFKSEDGDNN